MKSVKLAVDREKRWNRSKPVPLFTCGAARMGPFCFTNLKFWNLNQVNRFPIVRGVFCFVYLFPFRYDKLLRRWKAFTSHLVND